MTRRPHIALYLSLLLAACGGGGGGGDPDGGVEEDSAVTPDDGAVDSFVPDMGIELDPATYRAAVTEMLCRSYFECLNRHTAPLHDYVTGFTSIEECAESGRMQLVTRLFLPMQESIDDGHVSFDADRAAECLESEADYYCDETATRPRIDAPCDDVWAGLREDGETCREGECVSGTSCATGSECHGTCHPVMLVCPECESDEFCDGFTMSCTPLLAAGETCAASDTCQEGLVCDGEPGVCVEAGSQGAGEACENDEVCGEGHYCEGSQCRPYSIDGEGDSCGTDGHGCEPELICFATTSICEAPHAVGDPCVNNIGDCGADLYCDPATDRCAAQKANGTACVEGFECLSFYCPSATMVCAPPPTCDIP